MCLQAARSGWAGIRRLRMPTALGDRTEPDIACHAGDPGRHASPVIASYTNRSSQHQTHTLTAECLLDAELHGARVEVAVDWILLAVGAIVGAVVSLLVQNILYPMVVQRVGVRRARAHGRAVDQAWATIHSRSPRLELVQSGWAPDGTFADESIQITLGPAYRLPESLVPLRERHAPGWEDDGFFNGEQIGLRGMRIRRLSDDPERAAIGSTHILEIDANPYSYYDFLSTHVLWLTGEPEERSTLEAFVDESHDDPSQIDWPTPLSVGLSLFCDGGDTLFAPRRTAKREGGGYWEAGKVYNAVGEGMNRRDFISLDGPLRAAPITTAKRGLLEEVGLSGHQVNDTHIRMHSFALATDLLDYKFFGSGTTQMSRSEVEECWRSAPDRAEAQSAGGAMFFDVSSRRAARQLLDLIGDQQGDWAPEAVFSTVRSLLYLRLVSERDLLAHFGGTRRV
jgi:hypothetical protein